MSSGPSFDLNAFLPYALNQAAETLGVEFQAYYKGKYGMLRTEWRVLFHLGRYGDMTASEICDRARTHKTKVSRAVTALEKKRFLTRHERHDDRRHAELRLTRSGQRAFEDLCDDAQAFNARICAQMTPEEVEILHRCLIRLARLDGGDAG